MQRGTDEALMVHYLLNEVSSAEREQIEQRFFQDPDYFEALQAVEAELVDDYARGALAAALHERFEREWLTSPARRTRIETTKAMIDILREGAHEARQSSIASAPLEIHTRTASFRWSLAAAAIMAAVGALWLVVERSRLRIDLVAVHQERAELRQANQELQRQLANERARTNDLDEQLRRARALRSSPQTTVSSRSSGALIVGFVLPAGLRRSDANQNRLILPPAAGAVRLQADVPTDIERPKYRAVLRTPEGNDVWSEDVLPARSPADPVRVAVTVPSAVLPDGDYILTLQAYLPAGDREDVISSAFSVLRR